MGPKAQKEVLMVEGLDINDVQLPRLLRHVSKMLEDLMFERGERTRAQMESDLVRTALQNTEKEQQQAKAKRMKLFMEVENLGEHSVDASRKIDEELQFLKYEVTLNVQEKEKQCNENVQKFEQKIIEHDVLSMLDKKRNIQLEMYEKKKKLMEEVAIAGKEVVRTVDNHFAFSERVLLKRIYSMLKNVSIRAKYLSIFYKLQMMKLQEEKNNLIAELEENNRINFLRIQNFFKSIVQDDIVLIFALQEKLEGTKGLRKKRLQFIKDVGERLAPLKELMLSALNDLKHGYRMAETYEYHFNQCNRNILQIQERKKQITQLQNKKKALIEEIEKETKEKDIFVETMETKRTQSMTLVQQLLSNDDLFRCYGEYFRQLGETVDEEENLEKLRPGLLQELRKRLANEHEVVKQIYIAITKEIKFTNDLVEEAKRKFSEFGLNGQARFVKTEHKKFPYREGPSGIVNSFIKL